MPLWIMIPPTSGAPALPGTVPGSHRPAVDISEPRSQAEWDDAAVLVSRLFDFIAENTGEDPQAIQAGAADELADLAACYTMPHGRFLVARVEGAVVGTTGVVELAPGVAEIKRVYIDPAARGRKIAPKMLDEALAVADAMRASRVRLESSSAFMQKAVEIYRSYGFVEIAPYSDLAERVEDVISMELVRAA